MAELTNKLHIKSGSTVYDCTCYTTKDEATPKTVSNGTYWEIKNNNTVCYVGLVPSDAAGMTGFDMPLKVKKNNTEYIVQAQVRNYFTVTITQSANQTITVTCDGNEYTSSFTVLAGSYYTVRVSPSTGYTAGTPNTTSGYVNSNISISATAATKATYLFTIRKTSNQTITVNYGGNSYTSNASSNTTFAVTYGEKWTATIVGATGYNHGTLSATSGTITGDVTIGASSATIKTFTLYFGATTNQTYVATIGGTTKAATSSATSYTVNYGTSYSVSYTAISATAAYSYTASSAVSGTVTSNVSIPAKTATANVRYYLLKVPAVSNQYYTLKLTASSTYGGTLPSYTTSATQAAQNSGNGLSVPYGTTYSITYSSPSDGYNVGASKSGTVTSATTVTHNAATLKTYTLTLANVENGYWQVNGVTKAAGSYTYSHGTSLKVECFANDGYVKPTQLIMS